METKQTAVECFYEGLFKHVKASSLHSSNDVINDEWIISKYRIIELLKFCQKMEKEHIKNAYKDCHDLAHIYGLDSEKYYNETYGTPR